MKKLRVKLEKWVNGGYALAHHEGHAVFVLGGIPGESVDIKLDKEGSKEWFGTTTDVLEPSHERINSDCEVFLSCGGCSYRHINYENELKIKKSLLSDMFPKEASWIDTISGSSLHYRNNVQWQNDKGKIGFYSKNSHSVEVKANELCQNLDPKLLWSNLDQNLKNKFKKLKNISLRISNDQVINYDSDVTKIEVNGRLLQVPEKGFFQINQFLIQPWLDKIGEYLNEKEDVLELFCGCGTIGIGLSDKIHSLYGIELHQKSIDFAKLNAKTNHIKNFTYESIDLYQRPIPKTVSKYPTWIVNPPRAGLTKEIIESIHQFKPKKIIYSSCNPSTLKRDIVELKKRNYKITKLTLIDFFPRTPHYEVLCCIERT